MKKLLLALFVASMFITSPASATILEGDFLRVGVDGSGGLIDAGFTVGIDYDETGTGTWTSYDVLKPGTPFQFNSIGVAGSWVAAGYYNGNNFSATTNETSSGTTLSTLTTGSYLGLDYSQSIFFDQTSGVIHFTINLHTRFLHFLFQQLFRIFIVQQNIDGWWGGDISSQKSI